MKINMDDTIVCSNGKSCSRRREDNNERTREDPDQFDIDEESVRESLVSTAASAAANNERGVDHHDLALMDDDPQQRAGTRPTPERNSQMNASITVVSPRKKEKREEEDQVDVNNEQRKVFKTVAAEPEAAEQIATVSGPAAAKTEPVMSILTQDHGSSDYQQQRQQQQQLHHHSHAFGERTAASQQQRQKTQQQTATEAVQGDNGTDRKLPSAVARNLFDTSFGESDGDKGLPVGTAIRFRENKDDDWQTGIIADVWAGEIMVYKVLRHWAGKNFNYSYKNKLESVSIYCFVKNSDSFFQRLSKSDLVELEDRICSDFDQAFTSNDLEVTFEYVSEYGYHRITAKSSQGDSSWCAPKCTLVCTYAFTDAMLMRVGASLRRHCRDLKRCEVDGGFYNHVSGEAFRVIEPVVTTLCLTHINFYCLVAPHMLRELQLKYCRINSLCVLKLLSRSLRVLDFQICNLLNDLCLHDLDEFFEMQMGMKDPVLQCLKCEGAPRILDSLRLHDFLKTLHLKQDNYFDDALHVQRFLQETKVLQKLCIDFGFCTNAAWKKISVGLAGCASLQELIILVGRKQFDRQTMMTLVSALVQQAEDNQRGLRVLGLPWNTSLYTKDSIFDVLEQLERLPALRHFHLYGYCCQLDWENSVCNEILLDVLEHSLMLEKFEYKYFHPRMKASVDSLCRANRILNRHIPHILDAPEDVPPYLWSMILASVSPKAIGLFQLLHGYPNLADPKFLQTVVKKK